MYWVNVKGVKDFISIPVSLIAWRERGLVIFCFGLEKSIVSRFIDYTLLSTYVGFVLLLYYLVGKT